MSRRYQFNYGRSPRLVEYAPATGAAAFAVGLTVAAITSASDFKQGAVTATDYYGIWVVAALAWFGTIAAGLTVWRKLKAYQNSECAIAVDEQGITLRGLFGRPIDLRWSDVSDLELEQRSGKTALLIRTDKMSGAISLDDLNENPLAIWGEVRRCQEPRRS